MRLDKKKRVEMLFELERLANKDQHTKDETEKLNRMRIKLGIFSEKQIYGKRFVLEEYLDLVQTMPDATDTQRAAVMGITKNQMARGKKRNNLVNKGA